MSRKVVLLGVFVLAVIASGIFAYRGTFADLPPGVSPSRWIALTATSGIALKEPLLGRDRRVTHGILMVKVHDAWREVYLDMAPNEFMPAKP